MGTVFNRHQLFAVPQVYAPKKSVSKYSKNSENAIFLVFTEAYGFYEYVDAWSLQLSLVMTSLPDF